MPKNTIPDADQPASMSEEQRLKIIANVCLQLRKRADFFLNTEPENLGTEDFDRIADELEQLAQEVDTLLYTPE